MNRAQRRAQAKNGGPREEHFTLRNFLTTGDSVTRHHEAWALLEVYHERVVKPNRLYRQIIRLFTGQEWEIDPFRLWREEVAKLRKQAEAKDESDDG